MPRCLLSVQIGRFINNALYVTCETPSFILSMILDALVLKRKREQVANYSSALDSSNDVTPRASPSSPHHQVHGAEA